MKTPWELLKESKTKIKTTWRIAFVSALVLGLLIHLPVMLSDIPNHDGLSSMYFDRFQAWSYKMQPRLSQSEFENP